MDAPASEEAPDQAAQYIASLTLRVLRGINAILAAGENRDGPGCNAGAVRGGIDAAGEARYGAKSRLTESACEPVGDFHTGGRRIARADDRHRRQSQHSGITADRNQGR